MEPVEDMEDDKEEDEEDEDKDDAASAGRDCCAWAAEKDGANDGGISNGCEVARLGLGFAFELGIGSEVGA